MSHVSSYLKAIEKALLAGNATEHTHRPALKSLIESLDAKVTATNEPKRQRCGAPDYIVMRGQMPLGYIEAKDVGVPLEREERSAQMKRYRESLSNLILTDYLEFRWYVRDELRQTARLASVGANGKLRVEPEGAAGVEQLLSAFLHARVETVGSAKELAERMAAISQLIRDTIERALKDEDLTDDISDPLHDQLKGFRDVLIHDLTEEQFADMYAQTICYGLFAARCNARGGEPFTRRHAAHDLPRTNPFLRRLFDQIAGIDLDPRIAWAVDDLAELLNRTKITDILQDFGRATRREDPVVHFYETFLAAYDPAMREARGVYYTPEPVVSYIVRSVDHILKTDFRLRDGLADAGKIKFKGVGGKGASEVHKVLILDPATGTGTFLHGVVAHIHETFSRNRGMWSSYVSEHLLPRLFGFELLMAPYAVAHMKLGLQLAETGYEFNTDERLRVYLTNTLEEGHEVGKLPLFTQWLAEEANAASRVKQEAPVMVVLGNPPYSGHSANTGAWIANLLRGMDTQTGKPTGNYFEVDGQPLGERNPKWLNDDYVKFIRFAQWRIEQTGYGVLAFISNHGYLDNPTFRGMRQSLMETFDDIYVLDLHGNSKKKERAPDGSKDENVFDIQQGVAIGIFVKRASTKKKPATVRHAHLWGVREVYEEGATGERVLSGGKYKWLWRNELNTTEWMMLEPQLPFYLFVPQNTGLLPEYNEFWLVTKIFEVSASTVTTARNDFSMADDPEILIKRINDLRDKSTDDQTLKAKYNLKDVSYWKLSTARKELAEIKDVSSYVKHYCYRPFDFRYVYYHGAVCERLRYEVMQHMREENLAFLTHRPQSPGEFTFAYCTRMIGDQCVAANKSGGGGNSFQFPLYIYPSVKKASLFDADVRAIAPGGRRPNLAPEFVADLERRLGLSFTPDGTGDLVETFGPEDVFAYMYAVFHSPAYRSRYSEFLKIDFPRLPVTSQPELFRRLCAHGARLVRLHLLEERAPDLADFPVGGTNTVEAVRYTAPASPGAGEGRVWINREQYFANVPPEVWNFHVGGYQVAAKWLKDRKGRTLAYDDLAHYQQTLAALAETIRLMSEIDATIEAHGGWPLT
jgi:predicted helicase